MKGVFDGELTGVLDYAIVVVGILLGVVTFEIIKKDKLATDDELDRIKQLFHLYNIEYVNNLILAILELVYNVLQFIGIFTGSSASIGNKSE